MKGTPFYLKDPWLKPYEGVIDRRHNAFLKKMAELSGRGTLGEFASGHLYYGMQRNGDGLIFREWAPDATALYLTGSFCDWREEEEFSLKRVNDNGDWEITLEPGKIKHGDLYKLSVHWNGGSGERIPSYAKSVVQDDSTKIFSAVNWMPSPAYKWKNGSFKPEVSSPVIYEAHVGMSSEEKKVSSFDEFRRNILPRISSNGYNTVQLMAIQEHPYYGSFGYHVSNFFAVSSRFGTPYDLKALVDDAHGMGIAVIIDLVHSHSVSNVNEGLAVFDGNPGQYFHTGDRRVHVAWDSLCFDYGKNHLLHFLLSNCRYWIEEYNIDGFRFDGVTSMIYYDHGLGKDFTSYDLYFDGGQDEAALTYLALANRLIHEIKPGAITIAEEMSGMPGIACDTHSYGLGFDFRLAMGVPDFWIKLIKDKKDEEWDMDHLFHELTQHRPEERTISYCESHDQALVGDKTIIFRLMDAEMYTGMSRDSTSMVIERGIALHKMIRLFTLTTAQSGYLNFMGNEFGHPEWIDFPREGNNWSYLYARRQWSLADSEKLRYRQLLLFDHMMISFVVSSGLLGNEYVSKVVINNWDKVIAYRRDRYLFVMNFHPVNSYTGYAIPVKGKFRIRFDSDISDHGGFDRLDRDMLYQSEPATDRISPGSPYHLKLYLPSRTSIIFEEIEVKQIKSKG